MVSKELLEVLRCPACGDAGLLSRQGEVLRCARCGETYSLHPGYVDLLPPEGTFAHRSDYVAEEEAYAATLDYRSVGAPLLAAGVRQRMLERMLRLQPGDRVLDCGCGNGKFALWNRRRVALIVGLDPATLFADAALEEVNLVQGDARRLPFASASFDKAFSIDLFEHLTRPDLEAVLGEAHRLLRPGGRFLIYSNTREPSRVQPLINLWRALGRWLRVRGWATPDRYTLPKSDHVKVIATYEELAGLVTAQGFRIVQVRFWNTLCTSFLEHVLLPVAERLALGRRGRPASGEQGGEKAARARWREQTARRGWFYRAGQVLTWWMELDLILLGRLRSGSYFLLLERR